MLWHGMDVVPVAHGFIVTVDFALRHCLLGVRKSIANQLPKVVVRSVANPVITSRKEAVIIHFPFKTST